MLDDTPTGPTSTGDSPPAEAPAKKTAARKTAAKKTTTRKATTKKAAAPAAEATPAAKKTTVTEEAVTSPAAKPTVKTTTRKAATRSTTKKAAAPAETATETTTGTGAAATPLFQAPEVTTTPARKPRAKKAAPSAEAEPATDAAAAGTSEEAAAAPRTAAKKATTRKTTAKKAAAPAAPAETAPTTDEGQDADDSASGDSDDDGESGEGGSANRRRRRRGGRRRRRSGGDSDGEDSQSDSRSDDDQGDDQDDDQGDDQGAQQGQRGQQGGRRGQQGGGSRQAASKGGQQQKGGQNGPQDDQDSDDDAEGGSPSSRRRRRRRRAGEDGGDGDDDPKNTVTRVRQTRSAEDQIQSVSGSTRLEAKKQRRREGREAGRRRAPIVSEAEFLARRESVERVMAIRQRDDLTQIAVLEDKVLVEHYVARESQTSLIGNVYLGRVQNVLPSMEAAFVDIGKGRNAVLYAGEVNWSSLGHQEGQPRKIESVLSSGQAILVQVTKDPVGHKGARLTSQISLAGRFLVYVPDGTNSGISRKLPDTERNRLKTLLKEIVPDGAGVIVRTAAEGASEDELTRDVERLKARWTDIEKKSKGSAPQMLYGEPDLMLKVVRDLFTEDFGSLVVQGEEAWETVHEYVGHVAPDLGERLEKHDGSSVDLFARYRIDEQIHKGLDRKVWLPSGGSLVIDRTEAMTVVDVNTGKFTGSGGNLEETVTKNNLEAAEEIVRQLRLRDIGGIIVVDFIDMVLESNRDLVLRRLVECLGRDRTRHQVAEVTSLGLVQMTRKRIGTGLLEAFSETCDHCQGRGLVIADAPVAPKGEQEPKRGSARRTKGRGKGEDQGSSLDSHDDAASPSPSPKDVAAKARVPHDEVDDAPKAEDAPKVEDAPNVEETPKVEEAPQVEEPAVEVVEAPAEPVEPAAPKVVTRTRRRSASRPAGPPVSAPGGEPVTASAAEPATSVGVIGAPPLDGAVEPGTADTEVGSTPAVEHVPVKKRGSRKR